jgi:hypothetical protein
MVIDMLGLRACSQVVDYEKELKVMLSVSREEYLASIRR